MDMPFSPEALASVSSLLNPVLAGLVGAGAVTDVMSSAGDEQVNRRLKLKYVYFAISL